MADKKEMERGFLSRWSERKQARRLEEEAEAEAAASAQPEPELSPEEAEARQKEIDDYVAALPEPESLSYDSDFTVFFKEGVPEVLKRRALRVLWRSNPVLANLDGLIDYGEDFTDKATVVPNLKTLYRVGKGMFTDEDLAKEERRRAGLPPEETPEVAAEEAADQSADEFAEETPKEAAAAQGSTPSNEQFDEGRTAAPKEPAPEANPEAAPDSDMAENTLARSAQASGSPEAKAPKKRSALARRWGAADKNPS